MNPLKTNLALTALAGLLAIPAARTLFAAEKPTDAPPAAAAQSAETTAPNTLTDAEKAAGEVMMPCVSRSRTERLVLDL